MEGPTSAGQGVVVRVYATCADSKPRYSRIAPDPSFGQGQTETSATRISTRSQVEPAENRDLIERKERAGRWLRRLRRGRELCQDPGTIETLAVSIKRDRFLAAEMRKFSRATQRSQTADCPAGTRIVGDGVGTVGQVFDLAIAAWSPEAVGNTGADGCQV